MAGVALDDRDADRVLRERSSSRFQRSTLTRGLKDLPSLRCQPVGFPAGEPLDEALADVGAVGDQLDTAAAGEGFQALDGACELHAVVGGFALCAGMAAFLAGGGVFEDEGPAAGAGVAAARAIGVEADEVGARTAGRVVALAST